MDGLHQGQQGGREIPLPNQIEEVAEPAPDRLRRRAGGIRRSTRHQSCNVVGLAPVLHQLGHELLRREAPQPPVLGWHDQTLAESLAFRGATAIYKLHLRPAARYSEDLDLVQIAPEPIGPTLSAIRNRLDPWLGTPRWQLRESRILLVYRFESEDSPPLPLRLKIEINSREHFAYLGHVRYPFRVQSRWFADEVLVTTYLIDELFGTKLRALYQRKKGRDLFDLWLGLDRGLLDAAAVVECFRSYTAHDGTSVSRAEFEANLAAKATDSGFHEDVRPLLAAGLSYDPTVALAAVQRQLVARLPGEPWKRGAFVTRLTVHRRP